MRIYQCKACKRPIVFIKTTAGKSMPCDWAVVPYVEVAGGQDTLVTKNGQTVRGTISTAAAPCDNATGLAYRPHWASCTAPGAFKRRA